jgi:hypothetical protein
LITDKRIAGTALLRRASIGCLFNKVGLNPSTTF